MKRIWDMRVSGWKLQDLGRSVCVYMEFVSASMSYDGGNEK